LVVNSYCRCLCRGGIGCGFGGLFL
jgi:hypothetical protein